jgi:homocysteine S-methyltransferase
MNSKIKLLDGSMSFPMEQLGYNLKNKLWTGMALISDPDIIKNIHKDYINAGADYISTSTYQVSYDRLKNMGYQSSEIKKVFQKSVDLVKEAIKESGSKKEIKIVGSFGPFASYDPNASEYVGTYNSTDDEIKNFHLNNINIIEETDLDIILYETIPCLREIKILSKVLSQTNKEIWISITCNENIKFRDGSSFKEACKIISQIEQITTLGINCFSPLLVEKALKELKKYSNKKTLVYPNSGEKYNPKDKYWSGKNEFNNLMIKNWLSLSPDIIGGCCRVGYDNIKKMREEIDSL